MLTGPEYQNTSTLPISQLGSRSTQVGCGAAAPVWTIQHLSHFQALWSTGSTALMWGILTTQCPTRGTRISMLNIRSVILHYKIWTWISIHSSTVAGPGPAGQGCQVCGQVGQLQILQHGPGHPQCSGVLWHWHQDSQLEWQLWVISCLMIMFFII